MIAILGAGRLGESLVRALLSSGWRTPADLRVTTRHPERAAEIAERYGIDAGTSNTHAVAGADLVVVAVKPQDMAEVLAEIAPVVTHDQVILSVAAGVTTAFIESHLGKEAKVVRAMPNAPALVHEGIAAIAAGQSAGEDDLALAEEALTHVGAVVRVAETDLDAVTALSGSGPA